MQKSTAWKFHDVFPSDMPYSALMFADLRIGHHFSISAFWSAASAPGVC
jgi:hypothetical protein